MIASFVLRTKVNPAPTIAPCKMDSVWTRKTLVHCIDHVPKHWEKIPYCIWRVLYIHDEEGFYVYSLRLGGKVCLLIGVRVQAGSWA
jgi:hypothetical protein